MKYCRVCKTRAGDDAELCAQCGQPLAVLGLSAGAATGDAQGPVLSLAGQIQQLQAVQQQNLKFGKVLALACAAIVLFFVIVVYEVYAHAVLSYAVLNNVQIEQDPQVESRLMVSFEVVRPGKVAFNRRSGGNHTEKLDVFAQPGPNSLAWGWPSDKTTGIDFSVVSRGGWTKTAVDRHFAIAGKTSAAVDILFLLDTTSSMEPFIKGLKQKCIEFAGVVGGGGFDCRMGLLGFGDVGEDEPIYVFPPTDDLQLFQTKVAKVPRTDGGDEPESTIEALDRALKMQFRTGAIVCFVHITDASCHHEQRLNEIAARLKERGVVTYVVSLESLADKYARLCVNGGRFFAIEDARFDDILLKVARSISSQISSH